MDLADLAEAIELNDPDKLLRLIDTAAKDEDWDGILTLRERCYRAVDTGRQLWGVAHHAEYRLALEAPASYAGPMVIEDPAGFTLGPLEEVAASTHTWAELSDHVPPGPSRAVTAHERVVRGEDLSAEQGLDHEVLEIPLVLASWEPAYAVATYHADRAEFPAPDIPLLEAVAPTATGKPIDDPDADDALRRLVDTWVTESNGRAQVAIVRGPAQAALAALGLKEARIATITPDEALAQMAWAAASGGAHGRRKGSAAGRFSAWWAVAALAGILDVWPPPPEAVERAAETIRWFAWSDLVPPTGWDLHVAANDPERNQSWAITATDAA
ncbi:MAG: DUF6183 family protein [Acidimicrobiia bacterium]